MTCSPIRPELYESYHGGNFSGLYYFNFSKVPDGYFRASTGGRLDIRIFSSYNRLDYEVIVAGRNHKDFYEQPAIHDSLNRSDAEVTIVVINKDSIRYTNPVDDAVFDAHNTDKDGFCKADKPIAMIACADQVEICHTPTNTCTGLRSMPLNIAYDYLLTAEECTLRKNCGVEHLINDGLDYFFLWVYAASSFRNIVYDRGAEILSIRYQGAGLMSYGIQENLPDKLWENEARAWFGTSLAKSQMSILLYSIGSFSANERARYARKRYDYSGKSGELLRSIRHIFCHQVKFRSAEHNTFSLTGIVMCVSLCGFIYLFSSLDGLLKRLLFKKRPYHILAWELDSAQQLIRQLHESLKTGIYVATSLDALPRAYGTLGVPALQRQNGGEWIANYWIPQDGASATDGVLQRVVADMNSEFHARPEQETMTDPTYRERNKSTDWSWVGALSDSHSFSYSMPLSMIYHVFKRS